MLWIIFGLMGALAIAFTVWPLTREAARRSALAGGTVLFIAVASVALYAYSGSPGVPSGAAQQPDVDSVADMVASLAARLEQQPDDVGGWQMLARSYMTLGNFPEAVAAYQRLAELESGQNAQTLVDLGIAMAQADGQQLTPRAVAAFHNALALDPNHPEALFYAGIIAFNRGNPSLAADRWEKLLATGPPPEIEQLLRERIAVWRGEAPVAAPAPPPAAPAEPSGAAQTAPVVRAAISVSAEANAALPEDATVFVIARDPAQPSPPIAVTRRRLSEFPAVVELGDGDSMIPGRTLSGFAQFELVARVSLSGSPASQPGDWFGAAIVRPGEQPEIDLAIDERVR